MRAFSPRRLLPYATLLVGGVLTLSCGGDNGSPSPTATNVQVTPGADTLISVGATRTFSASVLDANGDPIDGATVVWSTNAPGVLTIDATSGVATAVANGNAQVKATSGTLEGVAAVVVAQIVASVTVTPGNAAFTAVGDTARFTAVAKDAGNTVVPGVQILWSVSDNTVATIDTLGLVRSKGPGTALVSAQAQAKAGYAAVGVAPGVTSLVILGAPASAVAGEPMSAALQVELRDANGNRVMNASLPITVAAAEDANFNVLHGTTTLITDQGRASFTGLWFTRTDQDRFMVTAGALPPVYSSPVAISPAAPAKVTLDNSIAASYAAGAYIPLLARVRDRFGNLVTNYNGLVTATVAQGPEGGVLFGGVSLSAVSGVATFATVNLHVAGGPWRLTAFLPGIPTDRDTTVSIAVLAGPPVSVEVTHLGPVFAVAPVGQESTSVQIADIYNNPADGVISIGLTGWPYAATPAFAPRFTSDTLINVSGGKVYLNLGVTRPGPFQLVVSSPGAVPDTTQPFIARLPLYYAGIIGTADEASCLLRTFCSGNNVDGLLRIDPLLAGDSIFVPNDTGFGIGILLMDGGGRHICAAIEDPGFGSHVECWGDNSDGQLGNGTVGGHSFVAQAGEIWNVVDLSAGAAHTCVSYSGLVQCWGRNDQGQLGRGTTGASSGTPTEISNAGAHTFLRVAAGGRHTCAIDDDLHIWCWGANDFGQLGDSGVSGANSAVPVLVDSTAHYSDVVAGEDFTCAIGADGGPSDAQVLCWGRNDKGQIGAMVADSIVTTPTPTLFATGVFTELAAGAQFACVTYVSTIGGVANECWGANDYGQLGRGTFTPFESTPQGTSAAGPYGVLTKMSAGAEYICGASNESQPRYVCWGRNDHGQFGSGSTNGSSTPAVIEGYY